MITREADYAIRIVARLAGDAERSPLSSTVLADDTGVPYRFLRKIVRRLVATGIVTSVRGRDGGLLLGRKPAQISLLDAIAAVDARGAYLNLCLQAKSPCERRTGCRAYRALHRIQTSLTRELAGVTFDELTHHA
jgi:Rrf2 family protein